MPPRPGREVKVPFSYKKGKPLDPQLKIQSGSATPHTESLVNREAKRPQAESSPAQPPFQDPIAGDTSSLVRLDPSKKPSNSVVRASFLLHSTGTLATHNMLTFVTVLKPPHVRSEIFLKQWAQPLLDSLRSLQAPHSSGLQCETCAAVASPLYRCRQCFCSPLQCQSCILSSHQHSPFHMLDRWDGHHFTRDTLGNLGLIIHLRHAGLGDECTTANDSDKFIETTVVHCNGIQSCRIQYCECPQPESPYPRAHALQLMDAALFPASFSQPKTAFTLEVLREFRHLSHHAKTNARDFMTAKIRMTNNVFKDDVTVCSNSILITHSTATDATPQNRYRELLASFREYMYLVLLMYFGLDVKIRQDPGSMAVLCAACPQPGINIDPDAHKRAPELW